MAGERAVEDVRSARPWPPRLILLCGLPGSGKSTLARKLVVDLPAVRLCPDDWLAAMRINLYALEPRERLEIVFWEHAQALLRLGMSVILESGFWLRSDRDEKRLGARAIGAAVELRYLDVPFEELVRRVEARSTGPQWRYTPMTRDMMVSWLPYFDTPGADELALFDPPQVG